MANRTANFWWQCARRATGGTAQFANDWQWLFGIPAVSGLVYFLASLFAGRGVEVIMQNHPLLSSIIGAFLVALGAFVITWLVAFSTRLFKEPVQLDHSKNERIGELTEELSAFREPNLLIDCRIAEGEPFVQRGDATQYRVSVTSPVAISDAELVVNRIKIGDHPALFNLHLRPMHERNPNGTKRVALKANKEEYWDLVSTHVTGVRLNCIGSFEQILPPGDYEFELMASGGDRPVATKIVSVQVRKDNTINLEVRDGRLTRGVIETGSLIPD